MLAITDDGRLKLPRDFLVPDKVDVEEPNRSTRSHIRLLSRQQLPVGNRDLDSNRANSNAATERQ